MKHFNDDTQSEKMPLYIGIDLGKKSHIASFISSELLAKHRRFNACPHLTVLNERAGFDKLLEVIEKYATPGETFVLLEHTGHYGAALIQFLQEHDVQIWHMHVGKPHRWDKTDVKDAQHMASLIYNQLAMGVLPGRGENIAMLSSFPDDVRILRSLSRHRYELTQELVRRKNKLTSIYDELLPEFTQIYKNPNTPSAMALREKFPTAQDIASASIDDLCATRLRTMPSRAKLLKLQELARTTIGSKDLSRTEGLVFEQGQLIAEYRLIDRHIEILDKKIAVIVTASRQGQIIMSMGFGPTQAGTLLAGIGNIANFPDAGNLKSYMGWVPRRRQTGTTLDQANLTKNGNRLLKQTVFMFTLTAITHNPEWKALYTRLKVRKCEYDVKSGTYKGTMKVIGRVAGQIIGLMYVLLKKDYDLLQKMEVGQPIPDPTLYSLEKHHVKHLAEQDDLAVESIESLVELA